MRIGIISDLHFDVHQDPAYLETLVKVLGEAKLDLLLNAGDLAESMSKSKELLQALRDGLPKMRHLYVPGNHDLWNKHAPEGTTTQQIIRAHLERTECLWNSSEAITSGWSVVGDCGWYDYSLGDSRFTAEELAQRSHNGRTWQDKLFVNWNTPDPAVHTQMMRKLTALIEAQEGRKVILLTHHISHPAFTVPWDRPGREQWAYFNAFLGSDGLYQLTKRPQVKIAVSGHVHYRRSFEEDGVRYCNRGLGYASEFPLFGGVQDLAAQIRAALDILEI